MIYLFLLDPHHHYHYHHHLLFHGQLKLMQSVWMTNAVDLLRTKHSCSSLSQSKSPRKKYVHVSMSCLLQFFFCYPDLGMALHYVQLTAIMHRTKCNVIRCPIVTVVINIYLFKFFHHDYLSNHWNILIVKYIFYFMYNYRVLYVYESVIY